MPIKVLVVDDEAQMEEMIRLRFRKEIRKKQYEFHFTLSGKQALECLEQEGGIDIILCDINMPEMDGLTLMGLIREQQYQVKIIMVTAYGNMGNIRAAMNRGAFDFLNKPIDIPDLKATVEKAFEELEQLRVGRAALEQLPITEQQLKETDEKARYLEELDQFKTRFFTNISHEFRTPLTVIKGMATQVREKPTEWLDKGSDLILGNAHQLLNLVSQILDLQKLEAGKLQLDLVQGEMGAFFSQVSASFHSLAEMQEVHFEIEKPKEPIWMDYDPEKMVRILSNLYSNAIKFTPRGGQITSSLTVLPATQTTLSFPSLQISVADSGVGIPEAQLGNIFDRFFQAEGQPHRRGEGTGIGLSLVKELVELMDGSISVESESGKGTTFLVELPITQQADREEQPHAAIVLQDLVRATASSVSTDHREPEEMEQGDLPKLLIIEDNPDIATYLVSCLKDEYSILLAEDGQAGIDRALAKVPDLIISDVMMPRKDGFEVCEFLKEHTLTSHIPIVLLTARSDYSSRIEGLKRGADDYLPKPFEPEELQLRLRNLLEARKRLQARYQEGLPPTEAGSEFEQEDRFMTHLYDVLEAEYMNPEFNIPSLCRTMGMSRSSLHRKVTALTSRSITNIFKEFRIKKAQVLLAKTDKPISEIAYDVGFTNPSYFNRVYGQFYGSTPSDYRKNAR
ncbi:MAG: response regulator [Bacteroidota bacterium]